MIKRSENMSKDLYDIARVFFEKAAASAEGKKALNERDEIYQFLVDDGSHFYAEIKGGRIEIKKGKTNVESLMEVTPLDIEAGALREIFEGKLRPYEAIEKKKLKIVAGTYEGSQITLLMRIAQDIVREEIIRRFRWE